MPNNPRIYLWFALALLLWLNYQAWMQDYGPQRQAATQVQSSSSAAPPDLADKVPHASTSAAASGAAVPAAPGAPPTTAAAGEPAQLRGGLRTRLARALDAISGPALSGPSDD